MSTTTGKDRPSTQALAECSICLGVISNRAVLDPCRHDFDYDCVKSWTNVNSNCPVCRCPVKFIHYSIISDREYSEEKVKQVNNQDDSPFGGIDFDGFDSEEEEEIYNDVGGSSDVDLGPESEFDDEDEDHEDIDVDSHTDSDADSEWEDMSEAHSMHGSSDIDEDFEEAANDESVQIIGEVNGDEIIDETVTIDSDDDVQDDDLDERPATPDYGDDPGDGGQSEDELDDDDAYEDMNDDHLLSTGDDEDEWAEANDGFDSDNYSDSF